MTRLFLQISIGILGAFILSTVVNIFVIGRLIDREMARPDSERLYDIAQHVQEDMNAPPERWPDALEYVRNRFPGPVDLVKINDIPDADVKKKVGAGIAAEISVAGGMLIYVPLRDGAHAVALGPVGRPPKKHGPMKPEHFFLSIAITIPIGGMIGFLLAYPGVRRLKILEQAAVRIAEGNLDARADISSADAVGSLALRFNRMADKIQSLLESQNHLLQAVSHELRTPISRIGFSLEMLSNDADPTMRKNRIAAMGADLDELEQLISELLLYCRLDVDNPVAPTEVIDAPARIGQLAGQDFLRDAGKEIVLNMGDEPVLVRANPRYFDRAVQNLLRNAGHHAAEKISVRVGRENQHAVIDICDDGPGIAAEDRERVFDPFTRLDDSRSRRSGGVGLGLAIVRRIVESYGGAVEIQENEGGGAKFVIRWPLEC